MSAGRVRVTFSRCKMRRYYPASGAQGCMKNPRATEP
jgi:hypothetical protein